MKEGRQIARSILSFDTAYIRWRAEFAPFEHIRRGCEKARLIRGHSRAQIGEPCYRSFNIERVGGYES
jgi:hypothetical protein